MKKLFILAAIAFSCTFCETANAQLNLGNIINEVAGAAGDKTTNSQAGNILGNLISAVAGDITTTKESLVGAWTYTDPAVQFESENLLSKAGGTAVAAKCESQLSKYYKIVGIKAGTLKFTFNADGTCQYGIGSKMLSGKYTFDSKEKTITITTTTGMSVKGYVTVTGNNMALCFDGSKLLTLFKGISSKISSLSTVSALASSYDGMKVGFKFKK